MGVSMAVIAMMDYLSEFGLGEVITQRKNLLRSEINCIFWFSVLIGLILSTICYFSAQYFELFFGKDGIKELLQVLSMILILKSLTVVPYKLLERKLKFNKKAVIDLTSKTISLSLAVIFASLGFGVWALVYSQVINAVGILLLSFISEPFMPYIAFREKKFFEMISFGSKIIVLRFLWYVKNMTDKIIGGKILLTQDFGFYAYAFQLASSAQYVIHNIMNIISVPVLSKLQDDNEKINRAFLILVKYTSLVIFPIFIGGSILSDDIIRVLLPAKWLPAAPIFSVACLVQIYRMMNATYENLYIAKGKPQYSIIMNALTGAIFLVGFIFCVRWGISGLLFAWMVILPIEFAGWTLFTLRNCKINFSDYLKSIEITIFGTVAMIIAITCLKCTLLNYFMTDERLKILPYLLLTIIAGALSYFAVIFLKNREIFTFLFLSKKKVGADTVL
jgi:O-antigen/teichoic acid export membrane protein